MTARLTFSLRSPTLDADMDAARAAGTLVNAWRLDDGRPLILTAAERLSARGVRVEVYPPHEERKRSRKPPLSG